MANLTRVQSSRSGTILGQNIYQQQDTCTALISHLLLFLVFEQSSRHPASEPQVDRAQHTSSIEHIAAALAQEKSVGRGASGWSRGGRKAVAPEMDTFCGG